MNSILNLTGIGRTADEARVRVGTPEEPLYIPAEAGVVKTGRAANASDRDRISHLIQRDLLSGPNRDPDILLPAESRQQRRAADRAYRRQGDKATRRFNERNRKADLQANHLAQMFNLDKGLVPAESIRTRIRARQSILRAVKTIVAADAKRFDREFKAYVDSGKKLPIPTRPIRHEEAEARLEQIALGATTRVPKAARI